MMQIIIRKKTLKACGAFLSIAAVFSLGLTMVTWVNPDRAASSARRPPAVVADSGSGSGQENGPGQSAGPGQPGAAGLEGMVGLNEAAAAGSVQSVAEAAGAGLTPGRDAALTEGGGDQPRETAAGQPSGESAASQVTTSSDYRINRLRLQGQHIAALEERSQDQSLSEAERVAAKAELLDELKRQELELSCEESLKVRGYHEPLVSIVEGKAMVLLNKGLIAGDSAEGVSSFVASISGVEQAQVMVVFPVAFVDDLPGE